AALARRLSVSAAQRKKARIGTCALGDRLPTQRCRAKTCAARQVGKRTHLAADEGIARIFALEARGEDDPAGQYSRHVFRRVHGEVYAPFEQRLLYLLS